MIGNLVFILKDIVLAIVVSIGITFYLLMFVIADELSKIEFSKFFKKKKEKEE